MATTIRKQVEVPGGVEREGSDTTTTAVKLKVFVNATADTPAQIVSAIETLLGLTVGATRPNVSGSLETWTIAHGAEGPWVYIVTMNFSSKQPEAPGGGGGGEIFQDMDFDSWAQERVVETDRRGVDATRNPNNRSGFTNTAHDRFSPLPIVPDHYPRITILTRSDAVNLDLCKHIGAVNNAAWTIAGIAVPIFCAKFVGYKPRKLAAGKFETAYTFDLCFATPPPDNAASFGGAGPQSPSGFIEWFLNAGFNEMFQETPTTWKKRAITLDGLNPIASPVPLDEFGMKLNIAGVDGAGPYPPIYLDFMPNRLLDFSATFTMIPTANPWA